jgi:hypothetical protein
MPSGGSRRVRTSFLIVTTLIASWLGMQLVHELGHVTAAYATGGAVERVVLHPLELSRTDFISNPRPLAVASAGPVGGAAIPLLVWALSLGAGASLSYLARFFSGFCLVANGAYVGAGAFGRIGDGATMLAHGAPGWALFLFALLTVPLGLFLWHGQGGHFGLGPTAEEVSVVAIAVTTISCVILIAIGCATGRE